MANIILVVALMAEIAFAAYCIITRSRQRRVRNWMRVGALALFILLALLSVIQWSFIWYGLALLLIIWAGLGVRGLLRKQAHAPFKAFPIIVKSVLTLLLIVVVMLPAFIIPQHRPIAVTGPHPVATVSYSYTDPSRIETFTNTGAHRQVNVTFWYPKDGTGSYPLVLFSHGSLGTNLQNASTFTELASNGYVVCSIAHPYIAMFTMGTDHRPVMYSPKFYQQLVDANAGKYDPLTEFQVEKEWMKVPVADIGFVLDTILKQASDSESEAVYHLIDPAKIGLMGHSLGGESAAQVARERHDISAVINLDADLGGEYVSYSGGKNMMRPDVYPVPILTILADDLTRLIDKVPNKESVIAVEHVSATAPHAYLVHIKGTDHFSLTDVPIISPFLTSMLVSAVPKGGGGAPADKYYVIETVNHLALTFFNAYLKGQGSFAPSAVY